MNTTQLSVTVLLVCVVFVGVLVCGVASVAENFAILSHSRFVVSSFFCVVWCCCGVGLWKGGLCFVVCSKVSLFVGLHKVVVCWLVFESGLWCF